MAQSVISTVTWPILTSAPVSAEEFVVFWDRLYSGYDEQFYKANVGKELTVTRIAEWFQWKNGTPLSPLKAKSILRYSSPGELINADADDDAVSIFLNKKGGAIWRIFWLHLQHPVRFPIYDQHVHRAMAFLLGHPTLEIPIHNPTKVKSYLQCYRAFFASLLCMGDSRRIDRALWAFGKFLGSEYGKLVHSPHP